MYIYFQRWTFTLWHLWGVSQLLLPSWWRPWVLGLPALSVKHLEIKAPRFYCFQKGPPAVPGQQPGPAPAAPAECPPSALKPTLPARRFADAGWTRSLQHRPFPLPRSRASSLVNHSTREAWNIFFRSKWKVLPKFRWNQPLGTRR